MTAHCLAIQTSFYGADPQRTVRLNIHGIHGVGRDTAGVICLMNKIAQKERTGCQLHHACCLCANPNLTIVHHHTMDKIAWEWVLTTAVIPVLEGVQLLRQDIDTSQGAYHQPSVGRFCQRSGKVMRKAMIRVLLSGLLSEGLYFVRILVISKKAFVGSNPNLAASLQHIRHIKAAKGRHTRRNFFAHQFAITLSQTEKSAVNTSPHRSVLLYVLDTHIGGIPHIVIATDVTDVARFTEGIAQNGVTHDMPNGSFGVAIDTHRGMIEQRADIARFRTRRSATHGAHIDHISALIVGYPESMELIFRYTLAGITAPTLGISQTHRHKREAVVTNSTTSIG